MLRLRRYNPSVVCVGSAKFAICSQGKKVMSAFTCLGLTLAYIIWAGRFNQPCGPIEYRRTYVNLKAKPSQGKGQSTLVNTRCALYRHTNSRIQCIVSFCFVQWAIYFLPGNYIPDPVVRRMYSTIAFTFSEHSRVAFTLYTCTRTVYM